MFFHLSISLHFNLKLYQKHKNIIIWVSLTKQICKIHRLSYSNTYGISDYRKNLHKVRTKWKQTNFYKLFYNQLFKITEAMFFFLILKSTICSFYYFFVIEFIVSCRLHNLLKHMKVYEMERKTLSSVLQWICISVTTLGVKITVWT